MYELNFEEKEMIDNTIMNLKMEKGTGRFLVTNEKLKSFIKKYEKFPENYQRQCDRIRYLCSRRNMTLNEVETVFNLKGGTISASSATTNHKVDAYLSRFFSVPISDFRNLSRYHKIKKKKIDVEKVIKKLRKLADDLEN